MPDRDALWEMTEESRAVMLYFKEAALAQCAFVANAGRDALHQRDLCTVCQRNLLMPAADAQGRLPCVANHFKDPRDLFRLIIIPWVALPAQDDVRRL